MKLTKNFNRALLVGTIATVGIVGNASANAIFSFTTGTRAASADFSIVGGDLQVVLTNTSSFDVLVPTDVLTALYFDLNGVGGLTPLSATTGGSAFYGAIVNNVGEGWQYGSGKGSLTGGGTEGISATGLGVFGSDPWFFLPANPPLNGIDYGLLSAGDNTGTGNGGITSGGPLIKDSITFVLDGLPGGFTDAQLVSALNHVQFQYGTALTEPSFPGSSSGSSGSSSGSSGSVPEPNSGPLALLGLGILGLLMWGRSRSMPA